jgi:hypothetical protein
MEDVMRTVALTRKHARVLAAVAAAEAADEAPSIAVIASRIPLRPDLVEVMAADLSTQGLLACSGEFPVGDEPYAPGPEFRVTSEGHRALSAVLVAP